MGVLTGIEGRLIDLYRELGEKSLDIMLFFRTDGPIVHANPVALSAYGYTYDELCGLNFHEIRAEETRHQIPIQIEKARTGSFRFETIHQRKDGSRFPVEATWSLTLEFGTEIILSVIRDITDKKVIENALRESELGWRSVAESLRESEARMRALVTASSDAIYRMSADWHVMMPMDGRGLVTTTQEPVSNWMELNIPPFERPRVTAVIQRAIETKSIFELEHQVSRPDGSIGWAFSRAVPILNENGEIAEWFGAASDITDRKRAEDTVLQSEERFRLLVQHSANLIWRTGPDGKYIGPQESFERFTGLSYEEYRYDGGISAVHPDDVEHVIRHWQNALTTRQAFEFEYRLRNREGEFRHTFTRGVPVVDARGRVKEWVGYAEDITERKIADEQRIALLRLEEQARREAETLNDLARTVASTLDLETLVQQVTDAATSLTGAEFGAFFYNVLNDDGESYTLYTLSGVPRSAFENFPMPRNTPIFEPTFKGTAVMRIDDVTKDRRYGTMAPHYGMPKGHLPVRSYLATPVISRSGEVLGGLFFGHSHAGVFRENHERLVVGLAATAAVAMDNARLFSKAQDEIERRRTVESELRSSQQHLQLTTEAAQIGTWEWHLAESTLVWSPIHKKLWGYAADKPLMFGDWSKLIEPADLKAAEAAIDACLSGASDTYDIEYRITPVGAAEVRWMRSIGEAVADGDGKMTMMRGVTYDITAEHLARQQLREDRDLLELKVRERTAQLSQLTSELQQEVTDRTAAEAQVRHFLNRIVDIQEEERHRIARNIHDDLGQHLTAFRINLRSLTNDINGELSGRARHVEQLAEELDSRIDAVTWELRPVDLENVGLVTAIQNLVTSWSGRFNIPADFGAIGREDIELPLETGVHLYRILQEALHNVAKHANATHAAVMVEFTDDLFKMIIEDDGLGFDLDNEPAAAKDHASLGLISMRERAMLINAAIEIESSPGSGTTVFVRVPIRH